MGIFKKGLIAAGFCLLAGAASATTVFDFRNPYVGGNGVNAWNGDYTMSVDGLTVTATAGVYTSLGAVDKILTSDCASVSGCFKKVTETKAGLGVGYGLRGGAAVNGMPFSFGELITLTFDQEVAFDEVFFTTFGRRAGKGSDFDLFIDGKNVAMEQLIGPGKSYSLTGLTGTSISFGADKFRLPYFGGKTDKFMVAGLKVSEIAKAAEVAAVPLPASAPLLAAGLLGFAALRRRRKAA